VASFQPLSREKQVFGSLNRLWIGTWLSLTCCSGLCSFSPLSHVHQPCFSHVSLPLPLPKINIHEREQRNEPLGRFIFLNDRLCSLQLVSAILPFALRQLTDYETAGRSISHPPAISIIISEDGHPPLHDPVGGSRRPCDARRPVKKMLRLSIPRITGRL